MKLFIPSAINELNEKDKCIHTKSYKAQKRHREKSILL